MQHTTRIIALALAVFTFGACSADTVTAPAERNLDARLVKSSAERMEATYSLYDMAGAGMPTGAIDFQQNKNGTITEFSYIAGFLTFKKNGRFTLDMVERYDTWSEDFTTLIRRKDRTAKYQGTYVIEHAGGCVYVTLHEQKGGTGFGIFNSFVCEDGVPDVRGGLEFHTGVDFIRVRYGQMYFSVVP